MIEKPTLFFGTHCLTNISFPAAAVIWWDSVWLKSSQSSGLCCRRRVLHRPRRKTERRRRQQEPIRHQCAHRRVWAACSDRYAKAICRKIVWLSYCCRECRSFITLEAKWKPERKQLPSLLSLKSAFIC